MKLRQALLPISYFPPLSHIAIHNQLDTSIELFESYQKRSYRNKCRLLGANGSLQLSVPLVKGKSSTPIKDVRISYDENWAENHIRTIKSAYGTSAYFDFYYSRICQTINLKPKFLYELAIHTFELAQNLELIKELKFSEDYVSVENYGGLDLRMNDEVELSIPSYGQVFSEKFGFVSNLSILDLLFNLGPESMNIINSIVIKP